MIVAYTDGGARGNPGPAGYGVRIESESGELLAELGEPLGVVTNNVAEYHGLLAALTWATTHGHPALTVRSDSELLVRQMRGEYKVRHPNLKPLYATAVALAARLDHVRFEHVPREANREADRLANLAMDEANQEAGSRSQEKGTGPFSELTPTKKGLSPFPDS
ncbi:MAG: reverse transcriptase-like protein [Luteitalea sp.]|nr:reverse transcriptase-like protein [Luteitalea sp.]